MRKNPCNPGDTPGSKATPERPAASGVVSIEIDGEVYTMGAKAAEELLKAMKEGRFTGFRGLADYGEP